MREQGHKMAELTINAEDVRNALNEFAASYEPGNAERVEVGRVILAPALQKTRAATEAQYLLMKYVFEDLNYRRYEWKCDSLNRPSANAAMRLGFTYEGRFRNHAIYKGRSRDTDWFSIIDSEWPVLKKRFENWLSPENFDEQGQQKRSLRDC